ncbi:glycerol kinase GlpK [Clostridium magnum]|uniref:Glycerol kinase n=1 Tax=Clostridium magnum DSM 2767 TaxID=1121326 RepID=A0A162SA13_9CLOT|nr:glycerol kinase GlpK [Clostridium magnum]KZL90967.1 glycerol kinase [Clostridium magnum DSM 2767]SHI99868.1 glycerol kinase [Clostridium magnum DSM 2767]
MGKGYILAVDQSTSGTKTMVVDSKGEILARSSREHKQYYPQPGWVEHDPLEIYENVKFVLRDVMEKNGLAPDYMDALAITNQRETAVVWDKNTGLPIYNAIVWQCRRTSKFCDELKSKGLENTIKDKTGLMLDPYFSATKVKWILDNVKGAREKANRGELLFGNIDGWLIWKLTGGKIHATDYTNASRTLLFNIKTLQWDKDLLHIFDIPESMLPKIKFSDDIFGSTKIGELFNISLPISGIIGDSQGALFGQQCFEVGMAKATYGTGSSVLMNIGKSYIEPKSGLVTAVAWGVGGKVEYALEGIIHCTGDAIKWVKENLGLFQDFSQMNQMISSVKDNEGVYVIPAFTGLGIPYWDTYARAAISGMSRGSNKNHVVRAAVESIAYQIRDAVEVIQDESSIPLRELRVDGGPTGNKFLMQFQADILKVNVAKAAIAELSSMGSVYIAGLAVGVWKSKEEIKALRKASEVYVPMMEEKLRKQYYSGWKTAVKRILTK